VKIIRNDGGSLNLITIAATGTASASDTARLVPFNYISGSTLTGGNWTADQNMFDVTRSANQPTSTTWTYQSAAFDAQYSGGKPQVADFTVDLFSPADSGDPIAEDRRVLRS
jgi:hypothetical protein